MSDYARLQEENEQLKAEIARLTALIAQDEKEDIEAADALAARAHKKHK